MNLPLPKNFEPLFKSSLMQFVAKRPSQYEVEKRELLRHLEDTSLEISETMAQFNDATEPCLIDMYAYQIKSLERKYSFYLSRVKNLSDNGMIN